MQIGVCYQLAFNRQDYMRVCQARSRINFVIGEWQAAHGLVHSASLQPGFALHGAAPLVFQKHGDSQDPLQSSL